MRSKEWTISATLDWTSDYFKRNAVPNERMEAELILAYVLNEKRLNLNLKKDAIVTEKQLAKFKKLILARKDRMPLAYLIGHTEFMGLKFFVDQGTLIPRPETELLVEEALKLIKANNLFSICDIFTGSGCIAVSIAKLSKAKSVFASDISIKALEVAQSNIDAHGVSGLVTVKKGDMFAALKGEDLKNSLDMITANPPYVSDEEMRFIDPEVAHEPELALRGGKDGLKFYKQLAEGAMRYLKPQGFLLVELSATRPEQIRQVFESYGYKIKKIIKDYSGHERVLVAQGKT